VSKKIQDFILNKKEHIDKVEKERNELRDEQLKQFIAEKENIDENRGLAEQDVSLYMEKIKKEEEERTKQDSVDQQNAAEEQAKIQEKLDMDKAARYVQKKWEWWQAVGK
jgi:CHASE3 domain sensor protein